MAHFENYNYLQTSDACVKCGKCLPDCTIFNINGDEATSPRGFIDLLGAYQRKEIELDKNAKEIFAMISEEDYGNSEHINDLIEKISYQWSKEESSNKKHIEDILNQIYKK